MSQDFESGLGSWVAATSSGNSTWHVVTNPQTMSVASALNPLTITLADTGAHLPAASGTKVAWFGTDETGTFIGTPYPAQTSKNGGTSSLVQTGTLTSPQFSLSGMTKAQLEFDSWWEVEGVSSTAYDLCEVYVSNNGGAFTLVGKLNPGFAAAQPAEAAYSSGGPAAAPVWRHYAYDLSAYAGSTNVKVQFKFNSRDTAYNAFRGFTVDNVEVEGGSALPAPTLTGVSPNVGRANDLVTIEGTNFQQGAVFVIGTTTIAAANYTQFGATSLIFKVPTMTAGTYNVKVTNPDGQTFTLNNAFTYTTVASPTVSSISPATANVSTPKAVTITGTNFVAGSTVTFGEFSATNVTVASATSITATAPGLVSGTYNVTVTSPSTQSGTKFAAYTVSDTSVIAVTAPTGGQSWNTGSTQNITWTATGASVVSIDLYKNGVFASNIASSLTASAGTYAWTIPSNVAGGTDYKVKVFNPQGTSSAMSAANFTIVSVTATTTTVTSSVNPSSLLQGVTFT
ncbi:MAG: IPT/TIG domain-containing protein, partial [Archangium sp.]|nr:IPT/TIG domain-containing protein [Archangium sp.]